MSHREDAVNKFCNGQLCSQAVLSALSQQYGVDRDTAVRFGAGFGGGMGLLGSTCGAVTGAVGILGLALGSPRADDEAAREKTFAAVQIFAEKFIERHGSMECKTLLNCDISRPQEHQRAKDEELFDKICPDLVGSAVEILDEILE